jgi:hypothetical protein
MFLQQHHVLPKGVLFRFCLFNDAVSNLGHWNVEWLDERIINWKGYGRKRLLPNLRYRVFIVQAYWTSRTSYRETLWYLPANWRSCIRWSPDQWVSQCYRSFYCALFCVFMALWVDVQSGCAVNTRYYCSICLQELRSTTKTLSPDSSCTSTCWSQFGSRQQITGQRNTTVPFIPTIKRTDFPLICPICDITVISATIISVHCFL